MPDRHQKLKNIYMSTTNFNWKMKLFTYKQGLDMEQYDVMSIVEKHILHFDNYSEKEVLSSLKESLNQFTYDPSVKGILENLDQEVTNNTLVYNLKHLYKIVERKGTLYRDPLSRILNIISKDDENSMMEAIINELTMYDWVPEIKQFVMGLTKNPQELQNFKNSGKGDKIYTLVENVLNENDKKEGFVVYVADRWFLINDKEIKQTLLEDCFKDNDKLRTMRMLEQGIKLSVIEDNKIKFKIDENLTLALSTKDNSVFLNEEKIDKSTSLENVFNSPIIPYLKKDYYTLISTVKENIDKFVDLDIAIRNYNILNPFLECYVFNFKDKNYIYSVDKRTGSSFYEYESVTELIKDVQKDLDYDLTHFFENKLSSEVKTLKKLEDREMQVEMKIKEVNESIEELKNTGELLNEDNELKLAFDNLLIHKHNLVKELNTIKTDKINSRKKLFTK